MPLAIKMLLLDTEVDGSVEFAALSVLPGPAANDGKSRAFPRVPVAGSKDWLSSVVEVGKQEVRRFVGEQRQVSRGLRSMMLFYVCMRVCLCVCLYVWWSS